MGFINFSHQSIGDIKGLQKEGSTVQFLGLQYATIHDRFSAPKLRTYGDRSIIDGTEPGPQVLSPIPGPESEFWFVQQQIEYDHSSMTISDMNGLNLNVTMPMDKDGKMHRNKLPVFVFLHGGGFALGSASFPQYDMERFVQLSVDKKMPIVAVSISYRVSAPGFLTSRELRDAGYKPNNGLRDQRTALIWIQKHIEGFGGNASEVTLMGESAGSVSVSYHLHSREPLFKRFMLMSGTSIPRKVNSFEQAEQHYAKAISALDLENSSVDERIKALNNMDGQELCKICMMTGVGSDVVFDADLVPARASFKNFDDDSFEIPALSWCTSALIGDCQSDGSISVLDLHRRKPDVASALCRSMTASLGDTTARRLLSAYDITSSTPDDQALLHISYICNDILFYAPTLSFAKRFSKAMNLYMYRFNEPNPWEGPRKGQAIHIQDLVWLLQNFREHMNDSQRQQAENFAESVITFVNGKACWETWARSEKNKALVIGPRGGFDVLVDEAPGNGRRRVIQELAEEIGMDELNRALKHFMDGSESA